MKNILFLITFIALRFTVLAQTDTVKISSDDLLMEINENEDSVSLLPSKFLITQKILWGNKGLMRNFSKFELSPESRELELKIRRKMLVAHQITGIITLGGMVAQGIIGQKLYNGDYSLKEVHEGLAAGVNISYSLTAALALFAPPKMLNEYNGYGSIKIHKYLAILHITSMIATNILAGYAEDNPKLKPYHRAAAFTAFGSLFAAMVIIKF
ncbi:MAG: hypothetical protein L3J74_08775 [Bacteroidales bacterium]|nr:hypothetical protein [Bacteroidales bacterium]